MYLVDIEICIDGCLVESDMSNSHHVRITLDLQCCIFYLEIFIVYYTYSMVKSSLCFGKSHLYWCWCDGVPGSGKHLLSC